MEARRHVTVALCSFSAVMIPARRRRSAQSSTSSGSGRLRPRSIQDRFSPLAQITRDNVAKLACRLDYRAGRRTSPRAKQQSLRRHRSWSTARCTCRRRSDASSLDPERHSALDSARDPRSGNWGDFANRGVSTWLTRARPGRRVSAAHLPGHHRRPHHRPRCENWNTLPLVRRCRNGRPPSRLTQRPFELEEYQLTSPPAVIGLIVTGSSVADNTRSNAASGEVRRSTRSGACAGAGIPFRATRPTRRGRRGAASWATRPAPRTHGPLSPPTRRAISCSCRLPEAPAPTTTAAAAWRQPIRQLDRRAALQPGSRLAFSNSASRFVGLRQRLASGARHHRARRSPHRRGAPSNEDRPALRARSRHGQADFPVEGVRFQRAPSSGNAHRRRSRSIRCFRHSALSALFSIACGARRRPIATRVSRRFARCGMKARSRRPVFKEPSRCRPTLAAHIGADSRSILLGNSP